MTDGGQEEVIATGTYDAPAEETATFQVVRVEDTLYVVDPTGTVTQADVAPGVGACRTLGLVGSHRGLRRGESRRNRIGLGRLTLYPCVVDVFGLQSGIMLLVFFLLLAIKIYAFISSLTFSSESYEVAGKLSKPAWTIILGLAVVIQLVFGGKVHPAPGVHHRGAGLPRGRPARARGPHPSMTGESETRPWGSWHVLDEGDGYKVKRIVVESAQPAVVPVPPPPRRALDRGRRAEATCVIDGVTSRCRPRGSAWRSSSARRTGSATTRTRPS